MKESTRPPGIHVPDPHLILPLRLESVPWVTSFLRRSSALREVGAIPTSPPPRHLSTSLGNSYTHLHLITLHSSGPTPTLSCSVTSVVTGELCDLKD